MEKILTSIPENAKSKAEDKIKERYPVQIVASDEKKKAVSEKEVEAAVEGLNPDENSMESRG